MAAATDSTAGNTGGTSRRRHPVRPTPAWAVLLWGWSSQFDRAIEDVVKAFTRVSLLEKAEKEFAKVNQAARDRLAPR
jgi:hypothetical protein